MRVESSSLFCSTRLPKAVRKSDGFFTSGQAIPRTAGGLASVKRQRSWRGSLSRRSLGEGGLNRTGFDIAENLTAFFTSGQAIPRTAVGLARRKADAKRPLRSEVWMWILRVSAFPDLVYGEKLVPCVENCTILLPLYGTPSTVIVLFISCL